MTEWEEDDHGRLWWQDGNIDVELREWNGGFYFRAWYALEAVPPVIGWTDTSDRERARAVAIAALALEG